MADKVREKLANLQERLPEPLSTYEITMNILISLGIGAFTVFLVFVYLWSRKKEQVRVSAAPAQPKPRFRKRDKIAFYGKKMLRRVKSFTKNTIHDASSMSSRRGMSKKKLAVIKLAKKLLRFSKEQVPAMAVREPPPSFLEADWPELEHSEHWLPAEVMYMLRSVRVLGHFEKPLFLELCKYMESRFIPAGSHIFQRGDLDDSIYVVQNGKIRVYVTEMDGAELGIKDVCTGESIHSLLSILDVLTSHPAPYKTVSAIALQDSTILRLPAQAFQYVLDRYPESLVRVVQIIMVRLQRVTFMALHNYLGLSYELINPVANFSNADKSLNRPRTKRFYSVDVLYSERESQSDKTFSVHSIGISPKGSPNKTIKDNRAALSDAEKLIKVSNFDEEPDTAAHSDGARCLIEDQKKKRDNITRKSSDGSVKRQVSGTLATELQPSPSDFDAACSRARVGIGAAEDASGVEELTTQATTSSKKYKKSINISENVSVIPDEETSSFWDSDNILRLATQDIVKLFGLDGDALLVGKVVLRHIRTGTELIHQGQQDASIIFVVTGTLQVLQQVVGKESEERSIFVVHPGEIVGSLAVLTGEPSFFTIRARNDARVVTISKQDFYSIMKEQPRIVLNVAHTVVKRMSAFVRQIDFALDWMQIEAGRALFRQGENSDCIYIVLNGRLRSVVTTAQGKKELVGEYGRGELVGIVEVLTQTERATTVMAVRDTELAQIPDELMNMIKRKYPQIVTRLIHLLGQRILGSLKNRPNLYSILSEHPNAEPRPTAANLATVAVVPVGDEIPLSNFTKELQHALKAIGPTLRLTSESIQIKLGGAALDAVNEYRLSSWLGQQEDIHRMVLYQCDKRMTPWTQRCIRQADAIIIVALADQEPKVGKLETQMENLAIRAQKELVLLHREDAETPKGTAEWLNVRGWCTSHHHLRCPNRVFSKKSYSKISEQYRRLFETEPDKMSDFSRLARFLTGTSIGLVLGGGGARGLSHVGIVRAMQEHGIPIDIVGGTSIGSLIGALWCEERNITRFTQRAREYSIGFTSLWKNIIDLTYPVTAMFSGAAFNKSIEDVFHDRQIEDLWIPYFCITTDITASKMRVHTMGSLWRYVRSSMSLSGYLPPMCDPVDGHLLLDGGYVNNLPADVIKAMGAQNIFAVDVGSLDEINLTNYGDKLSGWWLLWKRWNPWAAQVKVPNMAEVQSRLAYVSGVRQLELVKNSDMCEYIRPPIDKYGTLQFGSFDEIYEVGYNHGKTLFSVWSKKDLIKELFRESSTGKMKPTLHQTAVPREADFTDLAELISRIDDPRPEARFFIPSDDEYEDDEDLSVTSEPPVVTLDSPKLKYRGRAQSEGASLPDSPDEDEVDEGDEDDDEYQDIPTPPMRISPSFTKNL